jgi:hypothetical protein
MDGMPDEWEKQHGLDPKSAKDATAYSLSKEFTNVEMWLNGLLSKPGTN